MTGDGMAKADGKKAKKAKGPDTKAKGEKKARKPGSRSGMDALAKLADHPLVTDLLAIGAMAAVAAIAEHGVAKKNGSSSDGSRKAVKAAGKAAAAAIGQRLMKEVGGFGAAAKK
jgi:hypothetical protein